MSWQEELWRVLTQDYHLQPRLLEKYDTVYRLYAADGIYAIKEVKYPPEEFAYIFRATEHLLENGFPYINYMLLNTQGLPYFSIEDKKYFIAPWLPGRQLDYTNGHDVEIAALSLAKMHCAAAGFCPPFYKGRIKWGELIQNFSRKLEEITVWKAQCPETLFGENFQKEAAQAVEDGKKALALLEPVYSALNRAEEQWSGFCHHDYASHNIVLSPEGVGQIIDFDYCISDTGCHDLASLMARVLRKNEYQEELAFLAWQQYQKERILPLGAKETVLAFMLFPQDFWQCGFTYFVEKNRPETRMEKRLQGVLETRDGKVAAIQHLAEWM